MVSSRTSLHTFRRHAPNRAFGIGLALFILLYFTATVLFIIFA
jgi:hypothetical protein